MRQCARDADIRVNQASFRPMCLIACAWNVHPSFPLVLVANRDEFHARPTAALAPWDDHPQILGGRDLEAGGGWLAIDRTRPRLAAVTNVREPASPIPRASRGRLVSDYLSGDESAVGFAELRRADGDRYGPFNLLLWDGEELVVTTNRLKPRWETLAWGIHGLSNGGIEQPWPKTQRLMARLESWIESVDSRAAEPNLDPLYEALADQHRPDDAALPETGIGLERERLLSTAFIRLPGYGTRASQIVLIGRDGRTLFAERRFVDGGVPAGEQRLDFMRPSELKAPQR